MNWNDPASRLALIETVGPAEYNRRMKADQDAADAADPLFGKTVEVKNAKGETFAKGKVERSISSFYGALVKLDSGEHFYRATDCVVTA